MGNNLKTEYLFILNENQLLILTSVYFAVLSTTEWWTKEKNERMNLLSLLVVSPFSFSDCI